MKPFANDPHQTLCLGPNATQKKIAQAYHQLVKQYHPNQNPDDPGKVEKFKKIQRAYEILTGKEKAGSTVGKPRPYGRPFSDEEHPFFPARTRLLHRGFDVPPILAENAQHEETTMGYSRRVRHKIRAFVEKMPEILQDE